MRSLSTLNGMADDFAGYWAKVKNYINDLIALPQRVAALDARIFTLQKSIARRTDMPAAQRKSLIFELGKSAPRIGPMKETAIAIASRIQNYLPQWRAYAQTQSGSALGFAPVLAAAAFAALAYVAVQGLGLLKEYKSEKAIIDAVEAKTLTVEQAAALIKESKTKTMGTSIGEGISKALVPIALIGGLIIAGSYFMQRKVA